MLILPNLLWEMHRRWGTLRAAAADDQINGKNVHVGPLAFVLDQMLVFGPLMAPLSVGGVLWLLSAGRLRRSASSGVNLSAVFCLMMILHARKKLCLPAIYPLYFAAGAAAWDLLLPQGLVAARAHARLRGDERACHRDSIAQIILPVLPPAKILAYQQRLHLQPPKMENGATAPLPQYYADMLDWRQKGRLLAAAWFSLPQAERAAMIYTRTSATRAR